LLLFLIDLHFIKQFFVFNNNRTNRCGPQLGQFLFLPVPGQKLFAFYNAIRHVSEEALFGR
jgi:hypothetical protein